MGYRTAIRKWAAKRYDLDVNRIASVEIDHMKGSHGCPTCDYGGECEFDVDIKFTDGTRRTETEYGLDVILNGILEAEDG